jgi:hypothetical protein
MKRILWLAFACALIGAAAAAADTIGAQLTLYPASQGQQTQASWTAQEGEPDRTGEANQAVLLERDTTEAGTSAAAHIRGLEGVPVNFLVSLSFDYRVADGVCNVTDPRWALFIQGKSGRHYLINLGCATMSPAAAQSPGWLRRRALQPFIRAAIMMQNRKFFTDIINGNLEGLSLVFDRSVGHVFVDDVIVRARGLPSGIWTYAGDNGNGLPASPDFTADELAMIAASLPDEALWDEADVLASITPEEQAMIDEANAATD